MIEIDEVDVEFKEKLLCKGCSLRIAKGERQVILGASGSGKTTLLRLIAGFEVPSRGRVLIDGEVVSASGKIYVAPEERGVGMVFQELALWPHMSVGENIAFGLKMQGIAKKICTTKVAQMLALMGLEGYEKRSVSALSGGEKQRVALARALVVSPKILLMDEPLSSLDEMLNIRLRQEIVHLQEKLGFTLVYVTHNKDEAEAIATQIVLMEDVLYS